MIMTVEELRMFVTTDETDAVLAVWLEAMENMIQGYTNNNFHRYRVGDAIAYPADVKLGVVNLIKWELGNRDKVGIASESLSRHSVTYVDQTAANTIAGYPAALVGFLKPYQRARFGQGLMV
jgi:hypothetical protein